MSYKICVLPGDGIGKEVIDAAVKVLKASEIDIDFVYGDIGYGCYEKCGTPLPEETIKKVKNTDATLFGAATTPPDIENYSSPIVALRQRLELYANIRPCKSYPIQGFRKDIDMVIVRENTQGLYSGRERIEDGGNTAITERVITREGSERIVRYAYELAKEQNRKGVTIVHKANILRKSCGLFRRIALEVAQEYPQIQTQEVLVDAMAMQLIKRPQTFDVIVTTNLFGDILSDEACMLVGGLGLAASANIGEKHALFEPVHGSAPKYAGTNKANPLAAILSAKMMLEYLKLKEEAMRIEGAVMSVMKKNILTPDLNGNATLKQVAEAVIKELTH